jgi:hypothetical protein
MKAKPMKEKQRSVFKPLLLSGVLLGLASCSTLSVQTANDPHADLSKYKTYQWARASTPSSILDQTVKSSVEKELASKGLSPTEGTKPDLLVSYFGSARNEVNYYGSPAFGYPAYPYYGSTYVTREGSLTLQFLDPKTNRIVWQGTANDAIPDTGATQDQVAVAIRELIERYPTASG